MIVPLGRCMPFVNDHPKRCEDFPLSAHISTNDETYRANSSMNIAEPGIDTALTFPMKQVTLSRRESGCCMQRTPLGITMLQ